MRVLVLPADTGGCGHYRCIWPARALAAQGADVTLADQGSGIQGVFREQVDEITGEIESVELVGLHEVPDYDVIVIQRPLHRARLALIDLLQQAGIRVVVEIDDDFGALHPGNVSFTSCHPKHSPDRNWRILAEACTRADLVTVTTPALARRYGRHGRVAVIPNGVPARYLDECRDPQDVGPVVGWTGSVDTHPTDLQVTRGAVQRAIDGTGAVVAVVGTGKGVKAGLGLTDAPLAVGWMPLDDYPHAMAQMDIGIVPLDDIVFNAAKSALKLMEFSAVGVATVASPTPDNLRMFNEGIGLLADKPKHWTALLRRLINDEEHRAEVAGRSREVMRRFTIEGNTDRWMDAWASSLTGRVAA